MTPPDADPPAPRRPRPRSPKAGWVGPLFQWELVRLARRGQDARARFILATSLLVVLTLFTMIWFRNTVPVVELFTGTAYQPSLQESANFAAAFALTFVLAQLAVLVLLTPAYAAGGIAEEKEKQTFPFLLMTDLTDREVIFGKFLGRLTFLLGVTAAGLPILTLALLFGGISINFLLMAYFLTGTTVTLLASVGVASAASAQTYRGALFRAYGMGALHVLAGCGLHPVLSPFGAIVSLYALEGPSFRAFLLLGGVYGVAQLLFAAGALVHAFWAIRKLRAAPTRRPPRSERERPRRRSREDEADAEVRERVVAVAKVVELPDEPPRRRRPRRPPLPVEVINRPPVSDDDPFLWKERYVAPAKRDTDDESIRGVGMALGVVIGLTVAFFAFIAMMAVLVSGGSASAMNIVTGLLVWGGSMGFFAYLLAVGSAAASSVCRERQRQTLESLLTVPEERSRILFPKWRVALLRGWWWGWPSSACVALGLFASKAPLLGVPATMYVMAAAPLAAGYGLWLSIRCRTITRAVLWFLPAAGAMTLLPLALSGTSRANGEALALPLLTGIATAMLFGGWGMWRLALAAFERKGRN